MWHACPNTDPDANPSLTLPVTLALTLTCCAAACTNGNYLRTVGSGQVCAACVSRAATKAFNQPRNCYRSVSATGGRTCGACHRPYTVEVDAAVGLPSLSAPRLLARHPLSCLFRDMVHQGLERSITNAAWMQLAPIPWRPVEPSTRGKYSDHPQTPKEVCVVAQPPRR